MDMHPQESDLPLVTWASDRTTVYNTRSWSSILHFHFILEYSQLTML